MGDALAIGATWQTVKSRKVVKSARWLLLRSRENVKRKDRVKLDEQLKANRRLSTVYVVNDDAKHLFGATFTREQRCGQAIRIEPLKKFARRPREYLPGMPAASLEAVVALQAVALRRFLVRQ